MPGTQDEEASPRRDHMTAVQRKDRDFTPGGAPDAGA